MFIVVLMNEVLIWGPMLVIKISTNLQSHFLECGRFLKDGTVVSKGEMELSHLSVPLIHPI